MTNETVERRRLNSNLYEPPTNVRECLDWLSSVSDNRHAYALHEVIKKLPGCSEVTRVKTLCNAVSTFLGAFTDSNTISYTQCYKHGEDWDHMCKLSSGNTCCVSQAPLGRTCDKCNKSVCVGDGCQYCPKQIAARIFCLIVPMVFSALRYMHENFQDEFKKRDTVRRNQAISDFLQFLGYQKNEINRGGSMGRLKVTLKSALDAALHSISQIYEGMKKYDVSTNSFIASAGDNTTLPPKTIRDMMLWLQYLPYSSNYKGLKELITEKLKSLSGATTWDPFTQLEELTVKMDALFFTIEGNHDSLFAQIKELCKGRHIFEYPDDENKLLSVLVDYVCKIHAYLRFLFYMCSHEQNNGGWWNCIYNKQLQGSVVNDEKLRCECTSSQNGCPMPLLHFLTDSNATKPTSQGIWKNPFVQKEGFKMGFTKFKLYNTAYQDDCTGKDIYHALLSLIDSMPTPSNNDSKPLTRLTRYAIAISSMNPHNLGDTIEVFQQFGSESNAIWSRELEYEKQEKTQFLEALRKELDEFGIDDKTRYTKLENAVKLIASNTRHKSDHKNPKTKNNLCLILGCDAPSTSDRCEKYLGSLASGLYTYYVPQIARGYHIIDLLYNLCRSLYVGLKELSISLKTNCKCCNNGRETSKQCNGLVVCSHCLPQLYKVGLIFGDPQALIAKKGTSAVIKKCYELMNQLDDILLKDSPILGACSEVMTTVHDILLIKGVANMKTWAGVKNEWNKKKRSINTPYAQWTAVFEAYITKAIKQYKEKLFEKFLKTLCDNYTELYDNTQMTDQKHIIQIVKGSVTDIKAIIPKYSSPHADPFHYHYDERSNSYTMNDAINFHINASQCITPVPTSPRTMIDWYLRITVGRWDNTLHEPPLVNKNIERMSDEVMNVFKEFKLHKTAKAELKSWLASLVSGLRLFMGYEDQSDAVKKEVIRELETLASSIKTERRKVTQYLSNHEKFGEELGHALLKGGYEVNETLWTEIGKTISSMISVFTNHNSPAKGQEFADIVNKLENVLLQHHSCDIDTIQCSTLEPSNPKVKNTQLDGLDTIRGLFEHIGRFAAKKHEIGAGNGCDIVPKHLKKAEDKVSATFMNGINAVDMMTMADIFSMLHKALKKLSECVSLVTTLKDGSERSITTSYQYRTYIGNWINKLDEALSTLKITNGGSSSYIPMEKIVSAMNNLILETEQQVTWEIRSKLFLEICNACTDCGPELKIEDVMGRIFGAITRIINQYQHHIDDLKLLCQWLYRLGQLYANGLKDFVESLKDHLSHIINTIKWVEGIEKMLVNFETVQNREVKEAINLINKVSGLKDVDSCCQEHRNLCSNNVFNNATDFFTALNCRISNLLASYVIHKLPTSVKTNDNVTHNSSIACRRELLKRLRLLAIDRYTIQVWQDESTKPLDECGIRDWIVFKNGIIRDSGLELIKKTLSDLTGIHYNASNRTSGALTRNRIYNFHASCIIQKFSYQEPIDRFEESLKQLESINGMLHDVKAAVHIDTDSSTYAVKVKAFCDLLTIFCNDDHGIYNFAKFLHTILGPNVFSATMRSLGELRNNSDYNSEEKTDKLKAILRDLINGYGNPAEYQTNCTLSATINNLETFLNNVKKEYIFSYPVVFNNEDKAAKGEVNTLSDAQKASTAASQFISPSLFCENAKAHESSALCSSCYPLLARMFIASLPAMYHQLCFLSYQAKHFWSKDYTTDTNKALCSLLNTYGWPTRDLNPYAGIDVRFSGEKIFDLLNTNGSYITTLSLLDPINSSTLKSHSSPINKEAPIYKLYAMCVEYYQIEGKKAKNKRLEEYKNKIRIKASQGEIDLESVTLPLKRPQTLRETLLWIAYLPFFEGLNTLKGELEEACLASGVVYYNQLETVLYISSALSSSFLQFLECPQMDFLRFYNDIYTNSENFAFSDNMSILLHMLSDFCVRLFRSLKFLSNQCSLPRTSGGWRDCRLNRHPTASARTEPAYHFCQCGTEVQSTVVTVPSVVNSCSKPLRRYLTDEVGFFEVKDEMKKVFQTICKNGACREDVYMDMDPRGWVDKEEQGQFGHIPGDHELKGLQLFGLLRNIVGHSKDAKPLMQLSRFMVTLAIRPPDSLSGYFSFLYQFGRVFAYVAALEAQTMQSKPTSKKTYYHNVKEYFQKEIDLFPGRFNPKEMTDALHALVDYSQAHEAQTTDPGSYGHATADLSLISFCPVIDKNVNDLNTPYKQCGGYLLPLDLALYGLWSPRYCRQYLSWIMHFGPQLYNGLMGLRTSLTSSLHACCNTKTVCNTFIRCPYVLPELHSSGLHFYTPKFQSDSKTCADFDAAMDKILHQKSNCISLLCSLLKVIEEFLWSIRLPFSIVQFLLWTLSCLLLLHAYIAPLDMLKIKSHIFNKVKLTEHPSLLLAHSARKVTEVGYFGL